MRKRLSTVIVLFVGLIMPVVFCNMVWAGVIHQDGDSNGGNGTVPLCSTKYHGIHDQICNKGLNGGGKSWRVYKINYDSKGNSNTTMGNIDDGASWKVTNGGNCEACGEKVTILSECKKAKAPFIALFGVNTSVVGGGAKKFYVAYNRSPCNNNRGCYYKWNNYDAIKKPENVSNAYNGQTIVNSAVKSLYKVNNNGSTAGFSKVGAFCITKGVSEYVLTAYARDEETGSILYDGDSIDDDSFAANESASVSNYGVEFQGYTWDKWDIGGTICPNTISRECSNAKLSAGDKTVYANYLRDKFRGRTTVSGDGSGDTGFVNSDTGVKVKIDNCVDGCTISFGHQMKRERGAGGSSYTITRVSNTTSVAGGEMGKGPFNQTGPASVRNSESITLYPGDIVCETMSFYPETIPGSKTAYSQACVIANAPTPSINAKVRDLNASEAYHEWQDEIFGKPGDVVDFRTWYEPSIQRVANTVVNIINDVDVGSKALKDYGSWNNGYSVNGTYDSLNYSVSGTIGDTSTLEGSNTYDVPVNLMVDPLANPPKERSVNETALTNDDNGVKNVPTSVEFGVTTSASPKFTAKIDWTPISKTAYARIPYNFENYARIENDEEETVLYAGETSSSINSSIIVKPRRNVLTMKDEDRDYATRVDDVLYRYIVYTPSGEDGHIDEGMIGGGRSFDGFCNDPHFFGVANCEATPLVEHGDIPIDGNKTHEENSYGLNGYIPFVTDDVAAGSERCIAVAVFPATSGADSNWNDLNYDNTWRVSPSKCFKVAKRPSIQVWGGSVYSNAAINTPLSYKKHLAGYVDYNTNMTNASPYIFGSWGELGVIANQTVEGFASGASLGYVLNNSGTTWPGHVSNDDRKENPGGYHDDTADDAKVFCKLSPLTIANEKCDDGVAGNIGANTAVGGINKDRNALKNLAAALEMGESVEISGILGGFQEGNNYYKAAGDLEINLSEDIIVSDRTILIHGEGDIQISKNIVYKNDGYQNLLQTPKLIIYSDETINIDCTVTRIDAVLLAKTVDTCPTQENNWNSRQNSNQLFIYGAVIANTLKANRTYGAATGNNSIVPAEIIDFDPTLYLWQGANDADDDPVNQEDNDNNKSLNVDVVYLRELAPRY